MARNVSRHQRPEQIRDEVLAVLRDACPRLRANSWSPLTKALVDRLRARGRACGFEAWDSKGGGEYLWDVVWESRPAANAYWLELVAETEVSDGSLDEILGDFYRVLNAKARLKVFVCAPPSRRMGARLREEIGWGVRHQRYRLKEERLVVVLVEYDGRRDSYIASVRLFDATGPWRRWRRSWETVALTR